MKWILFIAGLTFLPPIGMIIVYGQTSESRLEQLACYAETKQVDACDVKYGNAADRVIAQLRNR